ncbi:MAG: sulfotransferase [Xanthobacteraceae bacterium]
MAGIDQTDSPASLRRARAPMSPRESKRREIISQALKEAVALQDQGKLPEAERLYDAILAADPDHFASLVRLGVLRIRDGQIDEAVAMLNRAAEATAASAEAQTTIGMIFTGIGRFPEAIACYRRALAVDPRHAVAHCNLASVLQSRGRLMDAIDHYEQALEIRPEFPEAHSYLGNVLQMVGRHEEAVAHYQHALELKPDYAEAHCNLGAAMMATGRPGEAIGHYQKAIALKSDFAAAWHSLGIALQVVGRLPEARRAFERAVALAPGRADFHLHLAHAKPFTAGDPRLAPLEALAREATRLGDQQQIAVHFTLGKAFADLGQPERSFQHLLEGNACKRRQISYDEAETLGSFERIRQVFTADLVRHSAGAGDLSSLPVFVIGMPRSGTTLVEQILASHSAVFGAGEVNELRKTIGILEGTNRSSLVYPEMVATMSGEDLRRLGSRYVGRIRAAAPWAERIVDKMPTNFRYAGLIHLALPNARIIHTCRDPIDTCLSCFSILFVGDQPYTYNLEELGHYHAAYRTLMEHWRKVLPPGVMLDVQYEDMVDDIETQARRIVAHCGLEWEDSCLAFHETQRPVQTASAFQVRRPIYRDSVGRSRLYGEMLEPLRRALDVPAP